MSEEKQPTSNNDENEIVIQTKTAKIDIPTSMIIAIVTALLTSLGSCAAAAAQYVGKAGQENDMKADIAVIKNDITWIKNYLSGSGPESHDSR